MPTVGRFTSGFGPRWGRNHNGVDIAAPLGTPIHAAAAGTVIEARPASGYGNLITIDHGGGIVTRYAHMRASSIIVDVGQQVEAGQQIAGVGNEGGSTGPHLHFEVRQNDQFINPEPFLAERGLTLAG
jgi:murein DD-endopeptidase MepM/ murein hydrolase activator NlpD